jgi:hypothetical protein
MEYPKFNLYALNPVLLKQFINESAEKGTLNSFYEEIRSTLKMLESPEYKKHNPEYTREDIQTLIMKFTLIFKMLICEKELMRANKS